VQLLADGCAASDLSRPYYFSAGQPCTVGIRAQVRWNPGVTGPANQTVRAYVGDLKGASYALAWDPVNKVYYRAGGIPVAAGAGMVPIFLEYRQASGKLVVKGKVETCVTSTANKCPFTVFNSGQPVQHAYSASSDEISRMEVGRDLTGDGIADTNFGEHSVPVGTHTFQVTLAIVSNLSLGGGVRTLRPAIENQNFSFNCGSGSFGSTLSGVVGGGKDCPSYQLHDRPDRFDCSNPPDPADCLTPDPGNKAGQIDGGMKDRVYGDGQTTCGPGEENRYPGTEGDPRLIPLVIVDYDAFRSTGSSDRFPVRGFASFYVTGWTDNHGNRSTCAGDEFPANLNLTGADKAFVFGRYVKHIQPNGPGIGASDITCTFNDVHGCVAVMSH
jgi:hypothetical protein